MDFWLIAAVAAGLALLAGAGFLGYFALATRRIAAEAERLVPPSGKFVTVGGNRIHYVEKGEGPPILFIHGLGAHLHHFRHPLFEAFGPGYRLIALDRPGSGYSVRAAGATARLPEQASVISGFIEALGLEKPLLVGHSLGGADRAGHGARSSAARVGPRAAGAAHPYRGDDQAGVQGPVHPLAAQAMAAGAYAGGAEIARSWRRGRLPSCSGRRSGPPTMPSQAAAWPG